MFYVSQNQNYYRHYVTCYAQPFYKTPIKPLSQKYKLSASSNEHSKFTHKRAFYYQFTTIPEFNYF